MNAKIARQAECSGDAAIHTESRITPEQLQALLKQAEKQVKFAREHLKVANQKLEAARNKVKTSTGAGKQPLPQGTFNNTILLFQKKTPSRQFPTPNTNLYTALKNESLENHFSQLQSIGKQMI